MEEMMADMNDSYLALSCAPPTPVPTYYPLEDSPPPQAGHLTELGSQTSGRGTCHWLATGRRESAPSGFSQAPSINIVRQGAQLADHAMSARGQACMVDDDFVDEFVDDFDEDNCSEDECHYGDKNPPSRDQQPLDDITKNLLAFATTASADVKKIFGNRFIYEEKDVDENVPTIRKSGRELYYADLMRIAQGVDVDDNSAGDDDSPPLKRKKKTSKKVKRGDLGPLQNLFQNASNKTPGANPSGTSSPKMDRKSKALPMSQRKLPASFWMEPLQENNKMAAGQQRGSPCNPDFSHLLETWDASGTGRTSKETNGATSG